MLPLYKCTCKAVIHDLPQFFSTQIKSNTLKSIICAACCRGPGQKWNLTQMEDDRCPGVQQEWPPSGIMRSAMMRFLTIIKPQP